MPSKSLVPNVDGKCVLLEGLSKRDREMVLGGASLRSYPAKALITRQGDPARRLYLVREGYGRHFYNTPDGGKIPLLWAAPGELIGSTAVVLRQESYMLSCETVRDSELLIWERDQFRGYTSRIPRLLDNVIHIARDYVEWLVEQHVALSSNSASERLASVLLACANALGEKSTRGVLVGTTNEELAAAAHITKYTTCRLLRDWQKAGLISKSRGKILLRDPRRLPPGK